MYLFLTAYLLLAIPSAAAVLRQKQTPVVAIAWLLAIVLLPIGGSLFYLLAGYRKPVRDVPPTDSRPAAGIERMLWYGCSTRVRYRNRVEQLHDGGEAFAALISALQGARRYIHLSYYIFADDRIGHAIADILVRKARAGVEVRLLYDAIGSWKLSERFVRRLRGAGIEVRAYAPLRFPWFSPRANRRNHSKIAVIDGRTGFVGGINIAERYLDGDALGRWRDEHLRIEGEAVDDLQRLFAADWALEGGEPLSEGLYAAAPADDLPCSPLQIAWTREDRSRTTLTDLFAQLIEEARHTLRISSPYFLPPPALYEALLRAVRRGCRVLVMLPARSDVWLAPPRTPIWVNCSARESRSSASAADFSTPNGSLPTSASPRSARPTSTTEVWNTTPRRRRCCSIPRRCGRRSGASTKTSPRALRSIPKRGGAARCATGWATASHGSSHRCCNKRRLA